MALGEPGGVLEPVEHVRRTAEHDGVVLLDGGNLLHWTGRGGDPRVAQGCGQAFLVGRDTTLCPSSGYADRVELWINHIMRPESMLGTQLSVSMEALEMQGRRGEYRFEISRASASACTGS